MADSDLPCAARTVIRMGRGRRIQIAVVAAVIWLAVAGGVAHVAPAPLWFVAALIGVLVWLATGALARRRT